MLSTNEDSFVSAEGKTSSVVSTNENNSFVSAEGKTSSVITNSPVEEETFKTSRTG